MTEFEFRNKIGIASAVNKIYRPNCDGITNCLVCFGDLHNRNDSKLLVKHTEYPL
jgi:hypothetical protein